MKRVISIYKIFGGFGVLILLNGFVGFGVCWLLLFSEVSIDKVDLLNDSRSQLAYGMILGLQFFFIILFATQNSFIIADNSGITFINPLIPLLRTTLMWIDIDYYLIVEEHARYTTHEAVWLVKDNKLVGRFSSFYYSNYKNIKDQILIKQKRGRYFNPFEQLFIVLRLKGIRDLES